MKTKYDWSNVPKWVKFIATDSNEITYGYEEKIKPYIILDDMFVGGRYVSLDMNVPFDNWRESLEERPNENWL